MNNDTDRNYYENGQIMFEHHYLNGKQHGIQEWRHNNGSFMSVYFCTNGRDDGMAQRWNKDGNRIRIRQKRMSNGHGIEITFHQK